MTEVTPIGSRKADHIRINLEQNVRSGISTGLERLRFMHCALPEIDLESIDLSQTLFKKKINAPLLISSMTGGTEQAGKINQILAEAAQAAKIAMGVGSQRAAIENPSLADSFRVRSYAPDILLFANIGAIQLNYSYTIRECQRAVDMIEADALILHFNALQEAVQPEGDTRFAGLLSKVEHVCKNLPVPVIAKEVGWGFSEKDVARLASAGVQAIDVAGAGGTSWSQVEKFRAQNPNQADLAGAFIDWGIPTAECIQIARKTAPNMPIIASGGLRSGIDVAKCIALGAYLGGLASPFLKSAAEDAALGRNNATSATIQMLIREIQIAMFAAGAKDLTSLQHTPLYPVNR
jgi:isopentenyl-diphosphate delta-isomerase